MKLIYSTVFALLVISLFTIGCKKDKDDEGSKNYFKVDGTEYELTGGFIENWGNDYGAYNLDLTLIGPGVTVHHNSGEVDSLTGTGQALYLEIFTSQASQLDVRDYTFDQSASGTSGTFDTGMIGIGYNFSVGGGTLYPVNGGTATVKAVGSEYEISFNLTASGKNVTGYYKGSLQYYNYGDKKASGTLQVVSKGKRL